LTLLFATGFSVCFLYTISILLFAPYVRTFDDRLHLLTQNQLLMLLLLGITLNEEGQLIDNKTVDIALSVILFILLVLLFILFAVNFFIFVKALVRARQRIRRAKAQIAAKKASGPKPGDATQTTGSNSNNTTKGGSGTGSSDDALWESDDDLDLEKKPLPDTQKFRTASIEMDVRNIRKQDSRLNLMTTSTPGASQPSSTETPVAASATASVESTSHASLKINTPHVPPPPPPPRSTSPSSSLASSLKTTQLHVPTIEEFQLVDPLTSSAVALLDSSGHASSSSPSPPSP